MSFVCRCPAKAIGFSVRRPGVVPRAAFSFVGLIRGNGQELPLGISTVLIPPLEHPYRIEPVQGQQQRLGPPVVLLERQKRCRGRK